MVPAADTYKMLLHNGYEPIIKLSLVQCSLRNTERERETNAARKGEIMNLYTFTFDETDVP